MTDIFKYLFRRVKSNGSSHSNAATSTTQSSSITNDNKKEKPYFPAYNKTESTIYRHRRQIGVNLGSIFFLDKSLAPPSLRSCIVNDTWQTELDFLESCLTLEQAKEALEDHWSTFVTEKDFEYMASIGINSVRIPIGYWILDCGQFGPFKKYSYVYQNAWYWLLKLVSNAAKFKIGVLVDLYGASGGQNTSLCGTRNNKAQFFKSTKNQEWTLKLLKKLATELSPINNVIGLNILSKPMEDSTLFNFYLSAYKTIRQINDIPIYISVLSDATRYIHFINRHRLEFVILDAYYTCFDKEEGQQEKKRKRLSTLFSSSTTTISESSSSSSPSIPPSPPPSPTTTLEEQCIKQYHIQSHSNIIIGEWTIQPTPKKQVESIEKQQSEVVTSIEQRLSLYNQYSLGHYFWNYRTSDDSDESSFLYCHKKLKAPTLKGVIPIKSVMQASQLAKSRFDTYAPKKEEEQGYAQGFSEGYDVALMYLELYQSQIGFKQHLAHQYSKKVVGKSYEKGFFHALLAVDQSIREFI